MARLRMEDGRVLDSACKRDRTPSDPPLERAVERLGKLHERLLSARRSPLGDSGFTPGFSRTLHAEAQWAEGVAALRRLLEDGRAAKSEYHKLMACVEAIEASTDDEQGARLREYEMKQVLYLGRRIRTAEAKFYRRQDGPEVDSQTIYLPACARILSVQPQGDTLMLWALVRPEESGMVAWEVVIAGTGHPVEVDPSTYLTTVQVLGGSLVWHIFVVPLPVPA